MPNAANKVRFGLKNCYYAPATIANDGTITYDTPVKLPGAVSLSLDPEGENENFYADDGVYYVVANNAGYSGDLELALVPDHFRQACLGEALDDNNMAFESAKADASPFALLFEFSGDVRKTRHVMYNCTASRTSVEGSTTEDSKTPQTETVSINAKPVPASEIVKAKTTPDTADAVYSAWFSTVQTPTITEDDDDDDDDDTQGTDTTQTSTTP